MNAATLSILTILLYLGSTALLGHRVAAVMAGHNPSRKPALSVGLLAVALHAAVLWHGIILNQGMDFGFFNALSLLTWLTAIALLATALTRPIETLGLFFLPLAALAVVLEASFASERVLEASLPWALRTHILFSLLAWGVLALAAVQSVLLAVQDQHLHARHPGGFIRVLPPLRVMEDLLFRWIGVGFVLLGVSLLTGLFFVDNLFAQHLAHKTGLSILAWLVFGVLLWGRHRYGWRGRMAIRWTLGGFFALLLAYLGSKAVLELILAG